MLAVHVHAGFSGDTPLAYFFSIARYVQIMGHVGVHTQCPIPFFEACASDVMLPLRK
jgi:hypothetical protein